jgi:hypothetical protein
MDRLQFGQPFEPRAFNPKDAWPADHSPDTHLVIEEIERLLVRRFFSIAAFYDDLGDNSRVDALRQVAEPRRQTGSPTRSMRRAWSPKYRAPSSRESAGARGQNHILRLRVKRSKRVKSRRLARTAGSRRLRIKRFKRVK